MTLKELLEKLPPEVKETFYLKVYNEIEAAKVIDVLAGRYKWLGDGWTKEGYYPERQDIDF